jgi:hypothetical protein
LTEPNREFEAAADDGLQALTELVENAQQEGDMAGDPARELATVLWALLHGLAQLDLTWHLSEPRTVAGRAGIERLIALTLDALRSGVGARHGRLHPLHGGAPGSGPVPATRRYAR